MPCETVDPEPEEPDSSRPHQIFPGSEPIRVWDVRTGVRARWTWLGLLLLPAACQAWSGLRAQGDWSHLRMAATERQRVAAARALAQDDTSFLAGQLTSSIGSWQGSDAEAYVAVAVAKTRFDGVAWLSQRVYGESLDVAFSDLLDPNADALPRLDWPALADGLMVGMLENPDADRWLALLAAADDGDISDLVLKALATNMELRNRVREAFNRDDMPPLLPVMTLAAFGAPCNPVESAWLAERYRQSFVAAIENRPINDNGDYEAAREAWKAAFPHRSIPLTSGDREMMRDLKPLLATDKAPKTLPPFEEIADFMTRHNRTGWEPIIEAYSDARALPNDALSFACRFSSSECSDVLQGGYVTDIASAADVAPALDLDGGDATMSLACSQLPADEARQLAGRAIGAGMPLKIREAGAACFMSLGDDVTAMWKALLPEAIGARQWQDVETIAAVASDAVDETDRKEVMNSVRLGEVRALDVPWLLTTSDQGAAIVQRSILQADPHAFDGLASGAIRPLLAPVAEHLSMPHCHSEQLDSVSIE